MARDGALRVAALAALVAAAVAYTPWKSPALETSHRAVTLT